MNKGNRGAKTGREEGKEHPIHFKKRGSNRTKRCSQNIACHVEDTDSDFGDRIEEKQFRFGNESRK